MTFGETFLQRAVILLMAASLAGCFDESSDNPTAELVESPTQPADPGPVDPVDPVDPITNSAPEISGTPPVAVQAGQVYSFTPTASDADNDFLEFSVENLPAWAQFSDESGAMSGTPTDAHVGETPDITITVTDGRDTRSIGPFRIRIDPRNQTPAPANTPPTISGAPSNSVLVGQSFSFQPTASDADGDTLRFSISNRPSWASFSSTTGRLVGTPGASNVGTYANIAIIVSDGKVGVVSPAFTIRVRGPDNRAPTISGSPATSVQTGQAYSFQPMASDPDNDSLTYSISNRPAWASFSTSSGRLSGTPAASHAGAYTNIVIRVSDGRASASLSAFSINVTAPENRAPTISGSPPRSVDAGVQYTFTPAADDPDDDTLGFTIQNRPTWATFETSTGRLRGTPTSAGSFNNVVISVSDGRQSASLAAFNITVNEPENEAPTISGAPATTVNANVAYDFRPTGVDPDGDTLTWSIENRPSWASFNANSGRLSGTPTATHAGDFSNIRISVSDGVETASLPAFTITVAQASASGSATLSWTPPTQNTDGTALTNLSGYRIAYGTSASALNQIIELTDEGLTTYRVDNLASGTWYFAVRAVTTGGAESSLSNVASKTIP